MDTGRQIRRIQFWPVPHDSQELCRGLLLTDCCYEAASLDSTRQYTVQRSACIQIAPDKKHCQHAMHVSIVAMPANRGTRTAAYSCWIALLTSQSGLPARVRICTVTLPETQHINNR